MGRRRFSPEQIIWTKGKPRKTVKAVTGFLTWPVKGQLTCRFDQRNLNARHPHPERNSTQEMTEIQIPG